MLFGALALSPQATAQFYQGSANHAMRAMAIAQASPQPQITLKWFATVVQNSWDYTAVYTVHRRSLTDTSWSSPPLVSRQLEQWSQFTVANGQISFTDTTVAANTRYEYRIMVEDETNRAGKHVGYGYVLAGINIAEVEDRGTALLVVEQSMATAAAVMPKIDQFKADLVGDGWRVEQINVTAHDPAHLEYAQTVKASIKSRYDTAGVNLRAVILLGHVPVPYSGLIAPDGHTYAATGQASEDHYGAWPADVYYADMSGTWTDSTANYTNLKPSHTARISNHPSDLRFDQSTIPSSGSAVLQVGRIDFANLTGIDQATMLAAYLQRDHDFRHRLGIMDVRRKAMIADNRDPRNNEAPVAPGYRLSAALPNGGNDIEMASSEPDALDADRWIERVTANTFLFTYAFGAGGNDAISGHGTTITDPSGTQRRVFSSTIVARDPKAVFSMLLGSWFGDWDQPDNLMRTMLTSDYTLTCLWGSRPTIALHQMGLGETIGSAVQAAQNNQGLHRSQVDPTNVSAWRSVHIALLGDPTLRAHPVRPVTNVTRAIVGNDVQISWSASTDSGITGYNVYRASSAEGPFTPAPGSLVSNSPYTDTNAASANHHYMVRAVKLEQSGSGSYHNMSQGISVGPVNTVATPTFSPGTGTYPGAQTVTITTSPGDATIRYTTNGTEPSQSNGTVYTGTAITISATTTLKAIAYKTGWTTSNVGSATYTIETGSPVITITAPDNSATVGSDTDLAAWTFSRTGSTASSLVVNLQYSGTAPPWPDYRRSPEGDHPSSVTFPAGSSQVTWLIRAWSNVNNVNPHNAICTIAPNANYTVGSPSSAQINFVPANTVTTPTFSPGTGTYPGAQTVTITTSPGDATIRYTTNGTEPSQSNGTVYNGTAITISATTTLKAIAYKSGWTTSNVGSATYTIETGSPVITITAPDNSATVGSDTDLASWTFSRTGSTASSLVVNLQYSGTAPPWPDYRRSPEGDHPSSVTFPAGSSQVTWLIRAWSNVNNVNPHNAICTIAPNASYTVGSPSSAQINFYP